MQHIAGRLSGARGSRASWCRERRPMLVVVDGLGQIGSVLTEGRA